MSQVWHRYRISDGLLMGVSLTGTEEDRDHPANNVDGYAWIGGVTHWRSQRVVMAQDDFGTLSVATVVDFIPPAPGGTELVDWEWDTDHREWVAVETLEALRTRARAELVAIMNQIDASLARPLAEAMQSMLAGIAVDEEATRRISAINAEKTSMRAILADIDAAASKPEVESLRMKVAADRF